MATHAGHTGSIKAVTSTDGSGTPVAVAEVKDWSLETTANLQTILFWVTLGLHRS